MNDFSVEAPPAPPAELLAQIDQLQEALASRTVTAQATGILAARFRLPTDRAWTLLRETSNMSNRKLADIAGIVVDLHNGVPVDGEDGQQVALSVMKVIDSALARVRAKHAAAARD